MNHKINYGCWAAIGFLVAFTSPMAKRKIVADKAHSTVTYAAKHPLHKWEGVSKDVNCAIIYNDDTKQPDNVAVSIRVASFDSDNGNRDSHAMEVLEGLKHPNVTFVSSDVKADANGKMTLNGTLTFHGVAKPVTVQVARKDESGKMTITGEFPVSLTEYNVERPSLLGLKTEDSMTLRFNIVFDL